ncbi:hypothetical protein IWX77_003359 [Cryobacterium sp. CAN_C2]
MESTSDYWKPFYYLLDEFLPVMRVNAKNARNIPGRKTDVSDAQWLSQLATHGLLCPSFVPPEPALVKFSRQSDVFSSLPQPVGDVLGEQRERWSCGRSFLGAGEERVDGVGNVLWMVFGREMLASGYPEQGRSEVSCEPLSVSDSLERIGFTPHHPCGQVQVHQLVRDVQGVLDIKCFDLSHHAPRRALGHIRPPVFGEGFQGNISVVVAAVD